MGSHQSYEMIEIIRSFVEITMCEKTVTSADIRLLKKYLLFLNENLSVSEVWQSIAKMTNEQIVEAIGEAEKFWKKKLAELCEHPAGEHPELQRFFGLTYN